jgi:capsular exopolysaccharide synthesis family protein
VDDPPRTVLVTSAVQSEGKTTLASNLALAFSQLGPTLLIDADLRKPRVHKVFKISNRVGVVNYLVGQVEAEEIFFRNGVPNLAVSPAGPIPPNPSELLSSPRMQYFLDRAREVFDYVVIDTPPTLAVTDSTIMGSIADGVVLTVRAGALPRDDAKASADRLRMAGVKVLGTVLNAYRPLVGHYAKDYHYYYHQAYAEDHEAV